MRLFRWTARTLIDVRSQELPALGWSFAWFFCLLFAYYVVRPIRETMATAVGADKMNRLFLAVFIVMLLAVPAYSFLVARVNRRYFVPTVYRFFAVWLVGFSVAMWRTNGPTFWTGCIFFVWVSVFNLFAVSVFWSVLADLFSSQQGKRLFGFVAAGGSLGGLCSSLFVGRLAGSISLAAMLLAPVLLLELALVCFRRLEHVVARCHDAPGELAQRELDHSTATGGGAWEGLVRAFRSPYLFGICLYLLLGKFCATTVYLELIEIVETQVDDPRRRTAMFANENFAVQAITLVFQAALAGFIMRRCGLAIALAVLPLSLVGGYTAMALEPTLWVAFTVQVMQRSLAYGLTVPASAVLFTVVPREDKYKTKSFIDTVIFRGGDAAASQLYKVLASARFAVPITIVMLPCAVMWALLSWLLGWQQHRLAKRQTS